MGILVSSESKNKMITYDIVIASVRPSVLTNGPLLGTLKYRNFSCCVSYSHGGVQQQIFFLPLGPWGRVKRSYII